MITGFGLLELFSDFNLILKLFVLMMIIGFVQGHLGKGPMATAVMGILVFFILFDAWQVFGGIYILYALITLGFSGILIDFFFVTPPLASQREQMQQQEPEGVNSQDVKERIHRLHNAAAQGRPGHRGPPGPPMMG
jgi:hypothetical protein